MNAKRHQDHKGGFNDDTVDDGVIDDSLSRAARRLHLAAVANVSASTQAQLHQRRRRTLSGKAVLAHQGRVRPLAWAGAIAVLALVIALPMAMRPPQAPVASRISDRIATTSTTTHGSGSSNSDTTIATLEEDPEMYVWLASSDAIALASE